MARGARLPMYWWQGRKKGMDLLRSLLRGRPLTIRNFGDRLSPAIVERISGRKVRHAEGAGKLLAIGSIFFSLKDHDSVWGSGLMTPEHVAFAERTTGVRYHAVRGPRTAALLRGIGRECPDVFGDPALLLPFLFRAERKKRFAVGLVPHHSQLYRFRGEKQDPRIKLIDVTRPPFEVVAELAACDVVLSTSLHGVIVAEAYGIPAGFLVFEKPLHDSLFKFEDYFNSTARDPAWRHFDPAAVPALAEWAAKQPKAQIELGPLAAAFPHAPVRLDAATGTVFRDGQPIDIIELNSMIG